MKLYVGSLSWGTDDHSLRNTFETFGEVEEARVIVDRESGRSRGFGFVTFVSEDDANNAISEMDGKELDGRVIVVNIARERTPRPRGGGNGGGGNGGGGGRW